MRINLASGQRPFKNWTNIDIRKQKDGDGNYYQCEIEADVKKLPLKDNSADIMVAHHVVEHFRLNEISEVVREWQRVLKPGGKLAFVITQRVWKTAGAGQGFRRFRIGHRRLLPFSKNWSREQVLRK